MGTLSSSLCQSLNKRAVGFIPAWILAFLQSWEENKIIYIDGKIYVPRNRQLRDEILSDNHNPLDVRHPGQHRMMELIKRNYWWSGIRNDV